MDGYIDDYIKAIRRNEVRDFFFGKGDYYKYNEGNGKRCYMLDFEDCMRKLGEQKLYQRLSCDYIEILRGNCVSSSEFHDLLCFLETYYIHSVSFPESDVFRYDWVYPEELTTLFFINYERLKGKDETKEIDLVLNRIKREYNVDILNFDRINVIGNSTVCSHISNKIKGEFVVPGGTIKIANYAFAGCEEITSIVMPDTVKSIGWHAFYECKRLRSIRLSSNLRFIGGGSFIRCAELESVYLASGVENVIDGATFYKCLSLNEIKVDVKNCNYVSLNGILYSKDLKKLIFCPSAIKTKILRIPESVTELEHMAFCDCSGIEELYIPASIEKKDMAPLFEGCSGLKRIHIGVKENIEKMFNEFDFEDVHKGCVLYVPKGTKDIYKKVLSESKDVNIIEEDV